MYLYEGRAYATLSDIDESVNGLAVALSVIAPAHDEMTHKTVVEGGILNISDMTYTLAVVQRVWSARIGDRDTVQEISEYPDEYRNWVNVPPGLVRHIRPGWLYRDGTLHPPTVDILRLQMQAASVEMAEEARQKIANPIGKTEVGVWLMNYSNVILHLAGMPTPLWEMALQIESSQTGETVEALRAVHIQRAKDFHALAALSQGMKRKATSAFAACESAEELLQHADVLRQQAAIAMDDPASAVAAVLEQK